MMLNYTDALYSVAACWHSVVLTSTKCSFSSGGVLVENDVELYRCSLFSGGVLALSSIDVYKLLFLQWRRVGKKWCGIIQMYLQWRHIGREWWHIRNAVYPVNHVSFVHGVCHVISKTVVARCVNQATLKLVLAYSFQPVKLTEATISFEMSVRPSVCTSAGNNSAFTGQVVVKFFYLSFFSQMCWEDKVCFKSDKNNGYFTRRRMYIYGNMSLNYS